MQRFLDPHIGKAFLGALEFRLMMQMRNQTKSSGGRTGPKVLLLSIDISRF